MSNKTGTIRRVKHDANYTVINTEVSRRDDLSWAAKGLHTYLMQLPDDWKINLEDLSNRSKDGKTATRTAMRELLDTGYATRKRVHNYGGRFEGYDYEVFECLSLKNTVVGFTDDGKTDDGLPVNGKSATNKYLNKISINELSINDNMPLSENESDYVKIETWSAETKLVPLNTASLKQDAPGGGASLQQYSDTDDTELRRRDPLKKTIGRKPGSKTGVEIDKITQVMEYLNRVTGFSLKANSAAALKHIGARLKEGATVADMMRIIDRKAGEWLGTEMQQYLVPDTLFNRTKFEKYMQQLDMPLPVRQQPQPRHERLRMDEPDFSRHGEKQIF